MAFNLRSSAVRFLRLDIRNASQQAGGEFPTNHRRRLHHALLVFRQAVKARGNDILDRFRHVTRGDGATQSVRRPMALDNAALQKRPSDLFDIKRIPLSRQALPR